MLLFFFLFMNTLASIITTPAVFVVITTFSIAIYVVFSLTFTLFFGIPFCEYKVLKAWADGREKAGRKAGGKGK
jgi:hypothetical protein